LQASRDACDRAASLRKSSHAGKIKRRLGGNPDVLAQFPPKSKGMWQRTYQRKRRRYVEAAARPDNAFYAGAATLFK